MRFTYRSALAHGPFRVLFAAQLVSIAGSTVAAVALTVLVYERTASPLLSSLTFALGFLPYALGGLVSALADRIPPRRLVVGCNLGSAAAAAAMAWPGAPIPLLLGLLVVTGGLTSLQSGGGAALLRAAVPPDAYVPARSLLRITSQLAQIGGNAGGGVLLLALSPSGAILLNAASFAVAAALVRVGVPPAATEAADRPPLLRDSLAGLSEMFRDRGLRRLLLLGWLVPTFSVAPESLAAPYVAGTGSSRALVGIWLVALPVGTVLGDLLGVWLLAAERQRRLVGAAAALSFAPYLLFATRPSVAVALPLLALSGLGGVYALGLDQRLRDAAPATSFGRVMTVYSAGLMTLQGLGFALAGAVAEGLGPAWTIAAAGVAGLAVAVAFAPRRAQTSETVVSPRLSA